MLKSFNLVVVPVIVTDRTKGVYKLSSRIISEAILGVISMNIISLFKSTEVCIYKKTLMSNAKIVKEGTIFYGDILIEGQFITHIDHSISTPSADVDVYDAEGIYVYSRCN